MSFDVINGFEKQSFDDILAIMTDAINAQFGTDYTTDTIVGSNHFKFFYGGLQLRMECDNKIAELGNKVIDYIRTINESISQPVSSPDGTIRYFKDNLGLDVSLKPITDPSEAGMPAICVDIDPTSTTFDSMKQQIFDALRLTQTEGLYWFNPSTSAGDREYRGESSALNGQALPYCFFVPADVTMDIRITVIRSRESLAFQLNTTQIEELFRQHFAEQYSLGKDFEGATYLNVADIDGTSSVIVEWSTDSGSNWSASVKDMDFDEKIILGNITVVEG